MTNHTAKNATATNATGIIDLPCSRLVVETADRLESLLKAKGIKVFSRIDQAAEAKAAGLTMRPTVLLIFGDPKAGTPLMNRYPSLAIDLPLKALVWESADGRVWLSYNSPDSCSSVMAWIPGHFRRLAVFFKLRNEPPTRKQTRPGQRFHCRHRFRHCQTLAAEGAASSSMADRGARKGSHRVHRRRHPVSETRSAGA